MYKQIAFSEAPTQKGLFKFNLHHCSSANKYKLIIDDLSSCPYPHPALYSESFISLLNIDLDWPYSYRKVREYFPLYSLAEKCVKQAELMQEWKGKTVLLRGTDAITPDGNWDVFCFGGVKKVFVSDRINIHSFTENHSCCGKGVEKGYFADIDKTFIIKSRNIDILIDFLVEWYAGKSQELDATILQIVKKSKDHSLFTFWNGF